MFQCMQAAMQCPPTKAGRPTTHWPPWETASLECLGRITPYTPRCQRRDSLAKDKLTEVTTRTLRLSARRSTSARPMAPVASPSTASSAPTEPSSTRTTSSATGGSTLTAPPPRSSTLSTTRLLRKGTPALEKHPEVLPKAVMPLHRPKHPALRLPATLQKLQGRRLMMGRALPRSTLQQQGREEEERSREDDGKGSGKEGGEGKASDEAKAVKINFIDTQQS